MPTAKIIVSVVHGDHRVIRPLGISSFIQEEFKELQQKVLVGRQLRLINKCCVLCL